MMHCLSYHIVSVSPQENVSCRVKGGCQQSGVHGKRTSASYGLDILWVHARGEYLCQYDIYKSFNPIDGGLSGLYALTGGGGQFPSWYLENHKADFDEEPNAVELLLSRTL